MQLGEEAAAAVNRAVAPPGVCPPPPTFCLVGRHALYHAGGFGFGQIVALDVYRVTDSAAVAQAERAVERVAAAHPGWRIDLTFHGDPAAGPPDARGRAFRRVRLPRG